MSSLRFGVLCALGYLLVAWIARFDLARGTQIASLIYPFDTFSMYSTVPERQASYLLARDDRGQVHSITSYDAFDCSVPIDTKESICNESPTIQYLDDDTANYVQTHPGGGPQRVEIIRRNWLVEAGEPPRQTGDCVIAECRVSP
ncbi:MAG: hypothetical protein AAF799_22015 [Myxococcota bacterium]